MGKCQWEIPALIPPLDLPMTEEATERTLSKVGFERVKIQAYTL